MKKRLFVLVLALFMLTACLSGCAKKDEATELRMYDGTYSEVVIVNRLVKLLVEENTDLTVTIGDAMSVTNMFREMTNNGSCDILLNYDGTAISSHLGMDVSDVPEGSTLYDFVNEQFQEKYDCRLLGKLGINNTYALATRQDIADRYNLKTCSDLVAVAGELTFGGEPTFFSEDASDRFGPFCEFYGIEFKDYMSIDMNLKYTAIDNGNYDVTEVYTTDGLNIKYNLVVLEDDRSFFSEYNGALMVKNDLFERFADTAPNLEEVLTMLNGKLSNEDMTEMTYAVDVEERDATEVAREWLVNKGLL